MASAPVLATASRSSQFSGRSLEINKYIARLGKVFVKMTYEVHPQGYSR